MAFSFRKFVAATLIAACALASVGAPAAGQTPVPPPSPAPTGTPAPKPTPAPRPYCMAVVIRPTNFRTGPSTRFHIIRLLPTYTVLKAYGKRGAWLDVADARGQHGWVWQPNIRISGMCAASLANH